MSFLELSSVVRSLFCTAAVIMCSVNVVVTLRLITQKRYQAIWISGLGLIGSYCSYYICAEVSNYWSGGVLHPIAGWIARWPFLWIGLLYVILMISAIVELVSVRKYAKTHIMPTTIQAAMDNLPVGVCIYQENGHPFLVNHKMSELAYALTGHALLNGKNFWEEIQDDLTRKIGEDKIYRFSQNKFELQGEHFVEILADDITEIAVQSQFLEEHNQRLQENIHRMQEYSQEIEETIRKEEILNFKISIHDEMNHLLLATNNAIESATAEERKKILDTWKKNILLLCWEADKKEEFSPLSDLEELAQLIGVKLICKNTPQTKDREALNLFILSAQEAMTNAVKHASAKEFCIAIEESEEQFMVTFTNDGEVPNEKVIESGGLGTLRQKIEKIGGTMHIDVNGQYTLCITLPIVRYHH